MTKDNIDNQHNAEFGSKPDHEIKIRDTEYHGTMIRVLEFDHHDSEQGGVEYKLPGDWKEKLKSQLEKSKGPIAPEYCLPDLEKYIFRANGPLGIFIKAMLGGDVGGLLLPVENNQKKQMDPDSAIVPFYSFITKEAGSMQRNLVATDTANKLIYRVFADLSMVKHQSSENQRRFTGHGDEFRYEYENIDRSEYTRHDSNDGRHLVSARGLMQESLRSHPQQITAIWAPKHAERIKDYIDRQVTEEVGSIEKKVINPIDFKKNSPREESKKMIFYGRPPLMRSVREYSPTLSAKAYEVDILLNDSVATDQNKLEMINEYLDQNPSSFVERVYQKKLKIVLALIKTGTESPAKKAIALILANTDKIGWKQIRKSYIY